MGSNLTLWRCVTLFCLLGDVRYPTCLACGRVYFMVQWSCARKAKYSLPSKKFIFLLMATRVRQVGETPYAQLFCPCCLRSGTYTDICFPSLKHAMLFASCP